MVPPTLEEIDALIDGIADELRKPSIDDGWFTIQYFKERHPDLEEWQVSDRLRRMVHDGKLTARRVGKCNYYKVATRE